MNNLHETFGNANLDFEIDALQARMIQAIVSFKLGTIIEYDDLTVVQISPEKYTVIVDTSDQIIEFGSI